MTTSAPVPPSEQEVVNTGNVVNGHAVAATVDDTAAAKGDQTPVPATGDGASAVADRPEGLTGAAYVRVAESPDFQTLRRTLRRFVFPLTAAFLIWYALYVLLSAFARDFMSTKVIGNINVALVFGLLQFVSTFVMAWAYARYADRRFDPLAEQLKARVESGADR